jgi:purine nucleoside phosphorylase
VCAETQAQRVAAALGADAAPAVGAYDSVCGPQFETPAEVAWLARYGDVVGMSAAPEARAAAATGVECCLLALVANVAAAVGSHEDVLAAGGRLAGLLASGLTHAVLARWPDLLKTL